MAEHCPVHVAVHDADFDAGALTKTLYQQAGAVGAVATFVGLVRTDDEVQALCLQHYPGMTEHSMQLLADEASARWPLLGVVLVHRVGRLLPGEQIVYVGVASSHRREALTACAYLADQLKTRAVLWKQEQRADGSRWLEPTSADNASVAAWQQAEPPAQ
ncbi:molybdenum cofactor biosynthesis protein MoaE [Permianibacter sp. IMCC34836]|uniref:molybdenum cofactor biosynthesis protein MoaE n=1 Tax=Permianibacter fluminis TaxID=2738515 RepID=UPI001552A117|nr:molybdenum cofactor biosynthesis protein MoaE [Permianibacter fluminis]NQD37815.1 molybdenum cofactor biosynthesis protein MoaE [Permianibacter fluminis]